MALPRFGWARRAHQWPLDGGHEVELETRPFLFPVLHDFEIDYEQLQHGAPLAGIEARPCLLK